MWSRIRYRVILRRCSGIRYRELLRGWSQIRYRGILRRWIQISYRGILSKIIGIDAYCGGCIMFKENSSRRIVRGGSGNSWFSCRRNNSRTIGRDISGCCKKCRGAVVVVIVVTGAGSTGV